VARKDRTNVNHVRLIWSDTLTSLQLLNVTLYNDEGETRVVEFRPGELNIVTGDSKAGKSTLLTIVDYCLGRRSARVPAGPIESTVAWYATLWQLGENSRVLLARPRFRVGASTQSSAMIEFGGPTMECPPSEQLRVNADADTLRDQLGQRIGLANVRVDLGEDSVRGSYSLGMGSAALFVFQD
jgi:energy-coupling factor transporter ATP-binding protein EcfA2